MPDTLPEKEREEGHLTDTHKDAMDGDAEGGDGMEMEDELPPTPHGHGAIHDAHDFLTAGQDMAEKHLQVMDNPKVREKFMDLMDQFEALSHEFRELCGQEYPDHPQPMPREGGMEMESEDEAPPEEDEAPPEEEAPAAEEEAPPEEDEEEEPVKKSRTAKRQLATAGATSEFSQKSAIERTLERKRERLFDLMLDDLLAE